MTKETRAVEDLSFGDALGELEQIVAALEGGQLELEESMTKYERGVLLLRTLQGKLADAQQKVTMLIGELEIDTEQADALSARTDSDAAADDSDTVPE